MGMDLCMKLMEMNKKLNIENFNLIVRLSEGKYGADGVKPQRWSKDTIRDQLIPYAGKLSKVWVCGPPILNQTFDMALDEIRDELQLESDQREIMW